MRTNQIQYGSSHSSTSRYFSDHLWNQTRKILLCGAALSLSLHFSSIAATYTAPHSVSDLCGGVTIAVTDWDLKCAPVVYKPTAILHHLDHWFKYQTANWILYDLSTAQFYSLTQSNLTPTVLSAINSAVYVLDQIIKLTHKMCSPVQQQHLKVVNVLQWGLPSRCCFVLLQAMSKIIGSHNSLPLFVLCRCSVVRQ